MKVDMYVISALNHTNLKYMNNVADDRAFYVQERTLYINPVTNEYDAVLDHLNVPPQDVRDPEGLEKIILGRMDKDILEG